MDILEAIRWLELMINENKRGAQSFPESNASKRAEAIETVLNRIKELEMEIQVLENTRNSCPCIKTSGVSCDLKSFDANDCISKDKIKEKIEEYLQFDRENKTYTKDGRENFSMQYFYARALEELLKEEE